MLSFGSGKYKFFIKIKSLKINTPGRLDVPQGPDILAILPNRLQVLLFQWVR
jgi:hypothetical protein